jgi:hypothetical protein
MNLMQLVMLVASMLAGQMNTSFEDQWACWTVPGAQGETLEATCLWSDDTDPDGQMVVVTATPEQPSPVIHVYPHNNRAIDMAESLSKQMGTSFLDEWDIWYSLDGTGHAGYQSSDARRGYLVLSVVSGTSRVVISRLADESEDR